MGFQGSTRSLVRFGALSDAMIGLDVDGKGSLMLERPFQLHDLSNHPFQT